MGLLLSAGPAQAEGSGITSSRRHCFPDHIRRKLHGLCIYLIDPRAGQWRASPRHWLADAVPFYFLSRDSQEGKATVFAAKWGAGPGIGTMGRCRGHQPVHGHIW